MTNQIDKEKSLRAAGAAAATIHLKVGKMVRPGVDLLDIEATIAEGIKAAGMQPAFKGFKGYPAVSCLSVNDEMVHAIPRRYQLKVGDVLKVDLGVSSNGWIVDCARTYLLGSTDPKVIALHNATLSALAAGIAEARPGATTGDIGAAIESVVKDAGFAVVRELTGHGVNPTLQEKPPVYNYGTRGKGAILKEGMVLAIEPITSPEPTEAAYGADGWTILSATGVIAMQEEDTILITATGALTLTR